MTPEEAEKITIEKNNEDQELCKRCGGKCCQTIGCELFPQDVKKWFNADNITEDMIIKLLESGYVTIDYYEQDIRTEFGYQESNIDQYHYNSYYLRMRNKNENVINTTRGGVCTAWSENGCIIDWDRRPTTGRFLIPGEKVCRSPFSGLEMILAWVPYYDILNDVWNKYLWK